MFDFFFKNFKIKGRRGVIGCWLRNRFDVNHKVSHLSCQIMAGHRS